ncbi:MAG: sugar transferase, partial [Elusimicrobia bacterium]|nr:sugar transferase [Elusimicrobiota bacterium]
LPMLLITALIKLDSHGPVFYFQKRVGYKGKPFFVWKFRTMVRGAEEMLSALLPKNNRAGVAFKMENDPRVTRLGRFLRHWSLDELPQLFNVLKGQMSLVGPRPQLPREVETYTSTAWRRLNMLPGITGLWQIRGRAKLSQQDMIALDLFYLENWSLALDIKILIKTIPAVLSGRGAY